MAAHYQLQCLECGAFVADDGLALSCGGRHPPATLVTAYREQKFTPNDSVKGIFRYDRWLPVRRRIPMDGGTQTFRSGPLNRAVGLPNLWLAFNGYWPERGATLETGTFKELEAATVLARL